MVRYVGAEELLILHALIIDESGGAHGVRGIRLFESVIEKPKASFGGRELYPSLIAKAAVFTEALVNYHVFVDGNKRTAFVGLLRFLNLNGHTLVASMEDIELAMVALADKSLSDPGFRKWLAGRISRIEGYDLV